MFWIVVYIDGKLPSTWLMLVIEVSIGILAYLMILIIFRVQLIKDAKSLLRRH